MSKSKTNLLVISNYNHDVSWVKNFTNDYIVYDRSDNPLPENSGVKTITCPNVGYNLYDYFTFIIKNYSDLPDFVTFCKGNIFPRHMSKERFADLMNNKYFTPLFDWSYGHKPEMPTCMFSSDGLWSEINNGAGLAHPDIHPTKYISSYNDLLRFLFRNPVIPKYITFAPGACYVVPKENILKYTPEFYGNLKFLISHCSLPGEAHLVERAMHTIWMGNFQVNTKASTVLLNDGNFHDVITKADALFDYTGIPVDNPLVIKYEIRIKDNVMPLSYLPLTKEALQNKPTFNSLFSSPIENFRTIHDSVYEAETYLRDVVLPSIHAGRFAEFIIDKLYHR
jgi:hypothetical protein